MPNDDRLYDYMLKPGSRIVKGKSKLPDRLQGPTGLEFRARGGKTATEMVTTVTAGPKQKAINAPLLVPGQKNPKRLLKGKDPSRDQVARGIKYAKAHGARRYDTVDDALKAESRRHRKLEKLY